MVGIISCGAYIPLWRISRGSIADGLRGEKAIAGADEDSITMAVAAALDCLNGHNRQEVEGLFFATTTSPYKEKLGASIVATGIDLRRDIITADFTNTLRAGTTALRAAIDAVKSGTMKKTLVVAADCRMGAPGSSWELSCGDGAVCFLIGDSGDIIAEIDAFHSVSDEMMDVWRSNEDRFIRSGEGRFVTTEGYSRVCMEAITGLMERFNLSRGDFTKAVFGVAEPRSQAGLARSLGFDPKTQLQDSMAFNIGETGAAYSLMLLQAALEDAGGNDRFLALSYGNGCDAMSVTVSPGIENRPGSKGVKGHLESKKIIDDYRTYAQWRELIPFERPPRPLGMTAPPALWREREQNIRLYGVKCKVCGTAQYPPQTVCTKCHTMEQFEKVRFSDRRGSLFTYSVDHLTWGLIMPSITAIVDFEGGGRIQCLMSEVEEDELKVDMPLDMSFRKMDFREGTHVYSWKCVPVR
ncbi:MAG: zinc ribbon domain-containing protein [Thermodesulfobacteriota bacterium]|nr:zinc ribbon domain-containing protein [Thermodesulfobacteriota bacterium]